MLVAATSVLVLFLAVVVLVVVGGDDTSGSRSGLIGRPAPPVELTTLEGTPLRLSELQGRRVIVNFFNDWCAPCRQELPDILAFNAAHADDPSVQWVWIARQYTESAIRRWVETTDPPGLVLLDPGERLGDGAGVLHWSHGCAGVRGDAPRCVHDEPATDRPRRPGWRGCQR